MTDYLELGKKYNVKMNDCCVNGSFTATVTYILAESGENERDEHYEYIDEVKFDNGVTLTGYNDGVSYEQV